MFPRVRPCAFLMLAFLTLCTSGCLVFEKQTIVCTFSANGDGIQALLIYEGLQVSGEQENSLTTAKEELTKLMTSSQNFYLIHPLMNVSLAPPKPNEKESEGAKKGRALLQKHLTISQGAFFVNPKGKLCAVQTVSVRDAQKFTEGMNELISLDMDQSITETLANKDWPADGLDEESLRLIQKAARDKYTWLRLEPGRLSFTLPGNQKTFMDFKRMALRDLLVKDFEQLTAAPPKGQPPRPLTKEDLEKQTQELEALVKFLADTPISIDQRRDRLTFSLGVGQGDPLHLNIAYDQDKPRKPNKYEAQLLEHARSLRVEFKQNVTAEALIADFLKKHNAATRR